MSDLFKNTAAYYARYRDFYPKEIISDIVSEFSLSSDDRVLDIGSGTGQLAIQLSKIVKEVIAVEPEAEMIEEGKKLAQQYGAENIHWINMAAENIGDVKDLGSFKLVTFATSFHWMDQEMVLKLIDPLIAPGGGLVLTGSPSVWQSKIPWQEVVREVIQKYLGEERRAGDTTFKKAKKSGGRYEDTLADSTFSHFKERKYQVTFEKTLDEVIGQVFSTSFANKGLLGDKAKAFEQVLRERLTELNPSGKFEKPVEYFAIFAKRR